MFYKRILNLIPTKSRRHILVAYAWLCSLDSILFPVWLICVCLWHRKKAVIIHRMEAIGDVVCTLPLCIEVRKKHPSNLLLFVTSKTCRPIVLLSKMADSVYGASTSPFVVRPKYLGIVTAVYNVETSDNVSDIGPTVHLTDDLAASCGFVLTDHQPKLYPSSNLIQRVRRKCRIPLNIRVITINPGPTWPVRNWPVEHWQHLIDSLKARYCVEIFQVGVSFRTVKNDYGKLKGVRSLVNKLKVDELTAVIAMSTIVISIDSGPIHIAGAVGTPIVGLFGAVNPALRLPPHSRSIGLHANLPCIFCHHTTPVSHWKTGCPNEIRCMAELLPEEVYRAACSLIEQDVQEY